MKLIEYFNQFLTDTVNLNQTRLNDLDTRVDRITSALKEAADLDGRVQDTVPQGSWAHRTIIRPATDLEFDADFLVQLEEDFAWNDDPWRYANAVWKALSTHSTYATMTTRKDRCVRVTYANDCHVDVITYVVLASGRQVIVNRETNEFEDTNPVGFTEWIQEKDELTNGNLRKVLRLLKRLRDFESAFSIKSVLLTTLVGGVADSWRSYDADYYKDVPTTLVHLVNDLDAWLQARPWKPSVSDPSCPTSFDHRWTEAQYAAFRSKIHTLAPRIQAAYDTVGTAASVAAWQGVFGDSFPSSVTPKAVTAGGGLLAKAYRPASGRAPDEQFIDELYPVANTHRVRITSEVSEPTYPNRAARRRGLRSRNGRVPKRRDLRFEITYTDVARPFTVLWKVRNHGVEATNARQLRGAIEPDDGTMVKTEKTSYVGHHYVECYIVKDGVCVATAHEPVIIT